MHYGGARARLFVESQALPEFLMHLMSTFDWSLCPIAVTPVPNRYKSWFGRVECARFVAVCCRGDVKDLHTYPAVLSICIYRATYSDIGTRSCCSLIALCVSPAQPGITAVKVHVLPAIGVKFAATRRRLNPLHWTSIPALLSIDLTTGVRY